METLKNECNALLDIFKKHSPIMQAKKVDSVKLKSCIMEMASFIIKNQQEKDALLEWMDKSDFYKSPASTKFHGNWDYGLAAHSLMVAVQALRMAESVKQNYLLSVEAVNPITRFDFTAEDVFVSAIAHDFCKAGSYKVEYHNTKDIMGNWTKKPVFKTRSDLRNMGHGNESVLLLLESMPSYIKKRHVLEAISRHMGFSDLSDNEKMNYSNFLQNPLVVLIQYADQTAAQWYDI